ncbi:RadC family protein [Alterisphingorhabdus coralli]|uniref:DNA repair protein RadC n=1 Tax=Alterisphingorhabdus coralli TaxID=3071408 RepID=A0AA97HZH2_9SPHN|nr:DNA repair protein RadC [Parasphingorhabdus sp. SCSIO 66989]WOE73847.1 DNA repair protein RadC [Parasphingorhabdus sp. SCSIO 66989]
MTDKATASTPLFPDDKQDKATDGAGHRARLRQRLLDQDDTALLDHEVIEYLLALAIPRRDTKPLAKALIARFGTLAAVLTADSRTLMQVPGLGETSVAALKIAQVSALRLLREPVVNLPVIGSWQALLDYLRADMAHLTVERVRILYLNSRNMVISDEKMSDGSVDEAAIYTRQVIQRALELGAVSLIMVHNHPSGNPSPSRQDIAITRDISEAGRRLNISVHDHIIIGRDGHFSMKAEGLI